MRSPRWAGHSRPVSQSQEPDCVRGPRRQGSSAGPGPSSGSTGQWPSLPARVVGPGPVVPAPSGTLLEMLSLRPQQDQVSQGLHFNKMPWDLCACQVQEGVPRNH